MAGDSPVNFSLLHRTCKLVVLLCFLHISVTVFFYVRSLDIRFAFAPNQQSHSNSTTDTNLVRNIPESGPGLGLEMKDEPRAETQEEMAGMKTGEEPEKKTGEEPEKKTAVEPEKKTAVEPEKKTAEEPEKKTAVEPEKKTAEEPEKKTAVEPEKKTAVEPEKKTAEEPEKKTAEEPEKNLEKCPETSPLLVGPLRVEFNMALDLQRVEKENPNLRLGGRFWPGTCRAQQKVAVIIPFRKRDEHLKFWLYYLHPILQRQQLDYGVYVINQTAV
ncbi:pharyngeal muscle protein 2-like [Etheostoma cragini]|uniref:pharyngeal muscle protein 2-like n=1 Tax=Etheostoma cragini TaxID=417921 RepID=UPI00155F45A6|nr:pharyngeal muscle protein 2-like [Etheostoma cragini]